MDLTIKEMRRRTGLSQSRFAKLYDIPVKTLQQWEQGSHNPPDYVLKLIDKALTKDHIYKPESTYLNKIVSQKILDENFIYFRSNIQHLIKYDELDAVASILSSGIIPFFYENRLYAKCLYLLACIDTICIKEKLPFCSDYDKYRKMRLKNRLVLCDETEDPLPEFVKYNIYERSIKDVY